MNDEKEIKKLRKEKELLRQELKKTLEQKDKIEKEKQEIEEKLKKTQKEFEEFKLKHAGTVENLKQALHIKSDVTRSSLKRGARQGHTAYTRKIPERVDHVVPLLLKKCPECGDKILGEIQETRERYITDLHFVAKVINTKYEIPRKYCRTCKKLVEPQVPQALPHARFGLNLMLFVMYLRFGLRLPVNKVCEFFQTIHGVSISGGEIILICHQLAKAYGSHYKKLERMLKFCKVKYSDTTSWRTNGKNYTAWVFITIGAVLYKITRRGTADIALKLFGKEQQGNALVVDRHSMFRSLAKKAGFILQFCWSHILGDTKGLRKNFGREGSYLHRKLKLIFEDANSLHHQGTEEQVTKLKERVQKLTKRHYHHKTVWRWIKNLAERDLEGLFLFVTNPTIDPTNNISERKLRTLVVSRKISNGSRSRVGAETTAILFSVMETLRHNNENIFTGLKEILKNTSRT